MSEIIKEDLRDNLGSEVIIFLKKGWRYQGQVLNLDDTHVRIFDNVSQRNKTISIDTIESVDTPGVDDE